MNTKWIPEGYHSATPYLIAKDADKAIEFYKKVFGATEKFRTPEKGKVMHAEIYIGNSMFMLADEYPDYGARGPQHYGGSPVKLHLYVENADSVVKNAVSAGAILERPVKYQPHGDRSGAFVDPFGHSWIVATHAHKQEPVNA